MLVWSYTVSSTVAATTRGETMTAGTRGPYRWNRNRDAGCSRKNDRIRTYSDGRSTWSSGFGERARGGATWS